MAKSKKEKLIYIIAGANGTGKTTLVKELLQDLDLKFLNADELALSIDPNNAMKARIKAGKLFLKRLSELLRYGSSFALETTLAGLTIAHIIKTARKRDYELPRGKPRGVLCSLRLSP